jgi:AmmeMemoRadiSam system protein A
MLSEDDRRELVRIARTTLREYLSYGELPAGRPHREALLQPGAAFCTLTRNGALRGCMGTLAYDRPLYRAVEEMAVSAATRDPRFPPVTGEEGEECEIELSVLTPLHSIRPDEIEIGRHGLLITRGARRGLLLPQVASSRGWSVEEFLQQTCRKAGLAPDDWRLPDAELQAFEAEVFEESDYPPIDPDELRRRAGRAK